jgi:tRNA A-37 threonylcarbamoyl transferase component Bud32
VSVPHVPQELAPDLPQGVRQALAAAGLDTVAGAFAYGGGQDLAKPGLGDRRRTRVELTDPDGRKHVLYLKRYGGGTVPAVRAALRRWLERGRRCSAAAVEFDNIRAARAAGVPTMGPIAYGQEPCPLGAGGSYLLVSAVPGEALERCGEAFLADHAADGQAAALTTEMARLVRTLHDSGYAHRDLYASHVFLDSSGPAGRPALYLIDLARMFRPRCRPLRWFVKDVAQLKFSMPPAWVAGQWDAFLAEYLPGVSPAARRRFGAAVDRKARSIARRARRRERRTAGSARNER